MNIYETLAKKQKRRIGFDKKDEYLFFMKNRDILTKFPYFAFLYDSTNNDFDVMRANIIIKGYLNKIEIESEIDNLARYLDLSSKGDKIKFLLALKERTIDLPYYVLDKSKVYIPFFSFAINMIYFKEPNKLLTYPYTTLKDNYVDSAIDPFDTYGPNLYDSLYTKLIKVGTNGREVAMFHYDTNTIYIINSQGRLDEKIVLFDKYIKRPDFSLMIERIKPVVEAFFSDAREDFVDSLYASKFISGRLYWSLKRSIK
jgi:hypothetical protein